MDGERTPNGSALSVACGPLPERKAPTRSPKSSALEILGPDLAPLTDGG